MEHGRGSPVWLIHLLIHLLSTYTFGSEEGREQRKGGEGGKRGREEREGGREEREGGEGGKKHECTYIMT